MLSIRLKNAIYDCLSRKEQAFLFLNRRGMANYLFCRECGYIFFCARCSVSLTYHKNENRLRCHYCNFTQHPPRFCMNCSGSIIKLQGFGTQKLEEEVHRLYPQAKIARLDRDTTRKHADFETAFRKIRAGEIDILIGTQMITKGHDFPNVTLVGVVSADISLNIPDFRSAERTFQLLTQVAGRAGRGEVPGQVIIQTSIPDHYVHKWTHRHDYEGFYKKELQVRRKLNYPPFTRLASLEIECVEEKIGRKWTWELEKVLSLSLSTRKDVEIIGPAPAMLYRLNERFRWRLILRSKATASLRALLNSNSELESFRKSMPRTVKLTLDIDPINLL